MFMRTGFEKRFNNGDIVYWCTHNREGKYVIKYGMVDEQFSDAVCIDFLSLRENRLVDGVPINDFISESRERKLPKGWTWNTELFHITYEDKPEEEKQFLKSNKISDPDAVKTAYQKGYLVKDETKFWGHIETEISKDGFRVVKKYPYYEHHSNHTSIRPDKVYFTYEEAKKEYEAYYTELKRQSELSDLEWSIEQIDKTLDRWKGLSSATDREAQNYREWLLGMKRVEDLEVRISGGCLQWKYWDKKKWHYIDL